MRFKLVSLPMCLGLLLYASGARAAVQQRPLTVLTYDNPPFITVKSGEVPQGMVLDVVRQLFRRVNITIDVRVYPLSRALAMMQAGDADAMFTMKKTAEREAKFGLAILGRLHATERVKIIGPPLNTAPSYLMSNKKTVPASLVARLDQELIAMHKDGSLRKIELKWGVPHDSSLVGAIK